MPSPYFLSNSGSNWGPPAGLAAMLAERDRQMQEAGKSIGALAGGLGAGAVGAFQGAANPGALGKTTGAGGALAGFAQNFASDYNGGGRGGAGGSPASGIQALMGGGGGGGGTPNVKQLNEAAKTADAFRNMMKASTPAMPGEEPKIFGVTDDEWKAKGAREKSGVLEAFAAQLKTQGVQLGIQQGQANVLQSFAAIKEHGMRVAEMQRAGQADAQVGPFMQSYSAAMEGQPGAPALNTPGLFGGPVAPAMAPIVPQTPARAFGIASGQYPAAPGSRNFNDTFNSMARSAMPVAHKVGGRDLIVNPNSGAFQDVTATPAPQIPPGMEAIAATEDENGHLQIRYGFPKAEGKALTQTEVSSIAALNQAASDLDMLENIYTDLGPDYGGPVSGRVKSTLMGGQNANIASLQNAITAATPNLARGVFREVGVLTDADVARYTKLLPGPYDTQEVRTRKIKQLRERIAQGRTEMVKSLKAAGRDVQGFNPTAASAAEESAAGGSVSRFDSEAAARSSGAKTGAVIELYDPATATYRKARLK